MTLARSASGSLTACQSAMATVAAAALQKEPRAGEQRALTAAALWCD